MSSNYNKILKRYWGYDNFRGIQEDIIKSICSGNDTLGLMPTGGGKSITFQVPALAMDGVCVVITPLIALMKDQVLNLRKRGIKAAAIYSGMTRDTIITTMENAIFGAVKILYVSPERLTSETFLKKLSHVKVSLLTIDEAHCISQWGYDFRPSYLRIGEIRRLFPRVPVLALTATATPPVVSDIQQRLGFKTENVFRMSFERKNLAYVVRNTDDKYHELLHILSSVDGSAIVYARSRKRTKEMAQQLAADGVSATFYHAGLELGEKDKRQKSWIADETRVIVATNAFGMGIDKPDVRVVIHIDCPDSIEAYFQEAGRAGRDGKKAYAILLYNNNDRAKLTRRIADTFPEKDYIRKVYEHLAYYYQVGVGSGYGVTFEFDIARFCQVFRHFPVPVDSALTILSRAGYIDYTENQDTQARVHFLVERDQLYRLSGNSELEDKVIVTLLRNYGGLFSDFGYISEDFVAAQLGMKKHELYQVLRALHIKHIINFIPEKSTPYIRYTQRREDSEYLVFPKEVYEERLERYKARIESMLQYATGSDTCRSQMLLEYFGESGAKPCMQCDVCIAAKKDGMFRADCNHAEQQIMDVLNDRQPHPLTDLLALSLPTTVLDTALKHLLDEETIAVEDGMVTVL
ncbi:MAG: RecQ family ATP-dependent DNA helicase [Prevotella sp.]|nr:RecQ family ATP-dependent DNA helicase [Prevotella sp.]